MNATFYLKTPFRTRKVPKKTDLKRRLLLVVISESSLFTRVKIVLLAAPLAGQAHNKKIKKKFDSLDWLRSCLFFFKPSCYYPGTNALPRVSPTGRRGNGALPGRRAGADRDPAQVDQHRRAGEHLRRHRQDSQGQGEPGRPHGSRGGATAGQFDRHGEQNPTLLFVRRPETVWAPPESGFYSLWCHPVGDPTQ